MSTGRQWVRHTDVAEIYQALAEADKNAIRDLERECEAERIHRADSELALDIAGISACERELALAKQRYSVRKLQAETQRWLQTYDARPLLATGRL